MGYVLWHWPRPGTSPASYDSKLVAFHESLTAHGPAGLVDVLSFRVSGLPWVEPRSQCREDWYLVRDFEALGDLNEAAVAAPNRKSHDEIAKASAGVAAGLYRLERDSPACGARGSRRGSESRPGLLIRRSSTTSPSRSETEERTYGSDRWSLVRLQSSASIARAASIFRAHSAPRPRAFDWSVRATGARARLSRG